MSRSRLCVLTALLGSLPAAAGPAAPEVGPPDYQAILDKHADTSTKDLLRSLDSPRFLDGPDFDVKRAADYKLMVKALQPTAQELDKLHRNGFAIIDHGQRYSMGAMYYGIYAQDLPVLITTDSVLHAMHRSFDDLLMELEVAALSPELADILLLTHRKLFATAGRAPAQAHKDADLYLSVARNLLEGAGAPEDEWDGTLKYSSSMGQDDAVMDILKKVQQGGLETPDTASSTLYGEPRMVDWSQFRPRGHYTKHPSLGRYFRAMMWLGRVDCGFELEFPRQVAAAAQLSQALDASGAGDRLGELDTLLAWLVGDSDNLGPQGMLDGIEALGDRADLSDPATLQRLAESVDGSQRIRSQVVVSNPDDPEEVPPPPVFQTFGQRFMLDSFVLSRVVFDSIVVGDKKVERLMPTGLDVAAAIGNDEAVRILAETELQRWPYAHNLYAARLWIDAQPASVWTSSSATTWLDALRTLDADLTGVDNAPQAMKTRAWQTKQLQTQLASWAELRHDTVLYAKQSFTAFPACEYPAGYVEPYPATYAAVARFAETTADALGAVRFGVEDDRIQRIQDRQVAFLGQMATTVRKLEKLAHKELAGKPFSPGEREFLKKTIDQRGGGSGPPRYDGWYPDLFYGGGTRAAEWAPEVVDVHTNPAEGTALSVGTGDVDFLVMAVDNEGDTRVYVGPVYSFYEFDWPAQDRLTDPKWGRMFFEGQVPARPDWMQSVLSDEQERQLE